MGVKSASKAALWSKRIAAFEASGQRRGAWCAAQGLNVNTFGYWRHRLGELASAEPRMPATALVPISVRRMSALLPTTSPPVVELEWPNGLRLRTTLGVPELGALVRALSPC